MGWNAPAAILAGCLLLSGCAGASPTVRLKTDRSVYGPGDIAIVDRMELWRADFCQLILQRRDGAGWRSVDAGELLCRGGRGRCCDECNVYGADGPLPGSWILGLAPEGARLRLADDLPDGEYRVAVVDVDAQEGERLVGGPSFRVVGPRKGGMGRGPTAGLCPAQRAGEVDRRRRQQSHDDAARSALMALRNQSRIRLCHSELGICRVRGAPTDETCIRVRVPSGAFSEIPREINGVSIEVEAEYDSCPFIEQP
jgi:hypothetical protein